MAASDKLHWYAIRATRGRAQSVYDAICEKKAEMNFEPYLPLTMKEVEKKNSEGKIRKVQKPVPLTPSIVFVNCSEKTLMQLNDLSIPGFTLYYNHTIVNQYGGNPLMIIPDDQFQSFRTIVDQPDLDIIVDQTVAPSFIEGDLVRVTSGPFKDVIGKVLKYKHQHRVFVQIPGVGSFGTAYVPKCMVEKIEPESPDTINHKPSYRCS